MNVLRRMAVEQALVWMDNVIRLNESQVRDLKHRRQQFREQSQSGQRDPSLVQVLGWFVNDANFVNLNQRLDLAVNNASALALTEERPNEEA